MKIRLTIITLMACLAIQSNAQGPVHTDSAGNHYWNKKAPVYLFVSPTPEGGQKVRLKSEKTSEYADPFFLDTEGMNYVRTRNAVDNVTREVIPDSEVGMEIIADGIAPVSRHNILASQKHGDGNNTYYSSDLSIELTASDVGSGIHALTYSINGEQPKKYDSALLFNQSGKYSLRYNSTDKVGNAENLREVHFIVDGELPNSNLNVNSIANGNVIGKDSKLYIQAYDSLSGLKMVYFKFDDQPYQEYGGRLVPFLELGEGEHTITYYSEDRVGNKEPEKNFKFYYDKSAPIMVADVLGDRFIVGDEIYFSGRTKLKLTAVDNKVGVKEVMFSIDNEPYQPYVDPIYLPSVSGLHSIRFYSVDHLNNSTADSRKSRYLGSGGAGGVEEYKHNVSKVYVDLTGPSIAYEVDRFSFKRNDTLFIGPSTLIQFSGQDEESGIKEINYSLNNELGEIPYTGPFTVSLPGYNTLNIYGYDNVKNRNVDHLGFFLDDEPPVISVIHSIGSTSSENAIPVYPKGTNIFLGASDHIAGIQSLSYKLDDGEITDYAGMLKNLGIGVHTLKVFATDQLKNLATKTVEFKISD